MKFCVCRCFFTNNVFVRKYGLHVTYENKNQFLKEYSEILDSQGCSDPEILIPEIEHEINRRKKLHEESWKRRLQIAKDYKPLYPQIFTLQKSFLAPEFLQLVEFAKAPECNATDLIKKMKEHQKRIYSFPVLTTDFCRKFVEELDHFQQAPVPRAQPNTMNRYGIKLEEFGYEPFITTLINDYIMPVTKHLFPDWGGDSLDSHKAFIVKYKVGEDTDLNYHFDNCEVTLNVALNDDYDDGEVYFGPMRTEESSERIGIVHELGRGLLHRSQLKHGALPISEGVRYNLILWMRSSAIRNQLCPMCDSVPKLEPVEHGFGDGFTLREVNVCCAT